MTATTAPAHVRVSPRQALTDTAVIVKRNVLRNIRLPQLLLFSSVQPVMFLILFNFVFGGALAFAIPPEVGGDYINWLIPGILIQSAVFGATATALGLTEDLAAGVIDRFRSLPMARSAVLTGRTAADVVRNGFVNLLMLGVGVLIGFRAQQGWTTALAGLGLALLFGYAMSWVMAAIGLLVKTPEAAQTAGFIPIFPLVFASSVFAPTQTMPDWLRVFAENQPITVITNAIRAVMITGNDVGPLLWQSLAWIVGIVAVFAPLAVRLYRRVVG